MPTDQRPDIDLFAPVANPPTWGDMQYTGAPCAQLNHLHKMWLEIGESLPADVIRGISGSAVDFARDMMRLDDDVVIAWRLPAGDLARRTQQKD